VHSWQGLLVCYGSPGLAPNSLTLSLSLYIYIYIERERESLGLPIVRGSLDPNVAIRFDRTTSSRPRPEYLQKQPRPLEIRVSMPSVGCNRMRRKRTTMSHGARR
jgi:hypothetical protein